MTASRRVTSNPRHVIDPKSQILDDPAEREGAVVATSAPMACQTPATDRLLTRKPAAEKLGMSISTFRRKVEDVKITPIKKGGVHFFRETAVLELAAAWAAPEVAPPPAAHERGKNAARVFDLFDLQVHPVDVVKQLELDPIVVDELHSQWLRMRRIFTLTPEQADQIEATMREWASDGSVIHSKPIRLEPVRSGEQLVARLEEMRAHFRAATYPCAKCKKAPRRFCSECCERLADSEKTRRIQIVEDAKTRRAQYAADTAVVRSPTRSRRMPADG